MPRKGSPPRLRFPAGEVFDEVLSKSAFARLIKCDPARITQMIKAGTIVPPALTVSGDIVPTLAVAQLEAAGCSAPRDPAAEAVKAITANPDAPKITYDQARTATEVLKAHVALLDLRTRREGGGGDGHPTEGRPGGAADRAGARCADATGQHTAGVYAQLRRLRDPRLVPLKGVSGWNRASPVNGPTFVDVPMAGKKIPRGLKLWTVAVDVFKAELYRRLWLSRGEGPGYPPGWVHLPDGLDAERVKQLVAETLVTVRDRRGFARQEWQKVRPNEQLDLAVYARAALSVLGSDRYGERFWKRVAEVFPVKQEETDAPVLVPATVRPGEPQTAVPAPKPTVRPEGVTITYADPTSPEARRQTRVSRLSAGLAGRRDETTRWSD